MHTLYLCYFGLREPLVQTQVLPYLRELQTGGVEVSLLTFEPNWKAWTVEQTEEWRRRLAEEGIAWHARSYHKRPSLPATLYDIAVGAWTAARWVRREGIDVLHGRAHVATAMGALARWLMCWLPSTGSRRRGQAHFAPRAPQSGPVPKREKKPKLVFDIRGFNPEEYVDACVWRAGGLKYRLMKRAERRLLAAADGFVVLTERAREILFPGSTEQDAAGRPIEVIPCCVDLARFKAAENVSKLQVRQELGIAADRVLVYVGALGGFYLTRELAEFIAAAHRLRPSTFTMILTQSRPQELMAEFDRLGLARDRYLIRQVPPGEISRCLKAADAALSFIKPSYSKQASSPTKIAEYLASGLPVVSNAGIGDLDQLFDGERVGVVVRQLDEPGYQSACQALDRMLDEPGIAERCRRVAEEYFDLQSVGGVRYRRLYERLASGEGCDAAVKEEVEAGRG
jgi:glycosyltransferase involved in cell wall biosynthesis